MGIITGQAVTIIAIVQVMEVSHAMEMLLWIDATTEVMQDMELFLE